MYRIKYAKGKSKIKNCVECGKEFIPASHGGTKQFCSYSCSNKHKWKTRERKPKKVMIKTCTSCGKEYEKNSKYSFKQWYLTKFCSMKCASEAQKIKDGMTTPERCRRKKGRLKEGTPAWLERIRATTKAAMARPEVQEKIRKPKGPMTEEGKIIRSDALVGILPKNMMFSNNGSFQNVLRGDYECSKGSVYFRSKWEANYALYLDFLIKGHQIENWEYEADTFFFDKIKLGTRSYRPDFKIFNYDGTIEYHEVKGYMDSRSKTKLKRMEIYFPDTKLILIERKLYSEILKKLKGVIKFY